MSNSQIILESSLQVYFFDLLSDFNRKNSKPLSKEVIFYLSIVLDKYAESNKFFDIEDGKIRDKILGLKLLESHNFSREKMKSAIKDVAEMSLLMCGYFSESMNKKIIDQKYYQDVGRIAYSKLNSLEAKVFDVNSFYFQVARNFHNITHLLNIVELKTRTDKDIVYLIAS